MREQLLGKSGPRWAENNLAALKELQFLCPQEVVQGEGKAWRVITNLLLLADSYGISYRQQNPVGTLCHHNANSIKFGRALTQVKNRNVSSAEHP